jgi:hypothetical protein
MMALVQSRRNQQLLVFNAAEDQQEEGSAGEGEEAGRVVGAQQVVVEGDGVHHWMSISWTLLGA